MGAAEPDEYLDFSASDRYARGETWLLGQYYVAASWSQELTPLVSGMVSSTVNLLDGSAFVSPSLSISVSDDVQAMIGGFAGLGEKPAELRVEDLFLGDTPRVNTEFGLMPAMGFVQMRAYF